MLFFALSSRWPRDPVKMQGFELAAISVAPSDFQNFFEVATGPCKNAVNRACGHFLSSLFSLLSFFCSLPSSLLGTDPFRSHAAGPEAPRDLIWDLSRPQRASWQMRSERLSCCCRCCGCCCCCFRSTLSSSSCLSLSPRFSLRSSLFF